QRFDVVVHGRRASRDQAVGIVVVGQGQGDALGVAVGVDIEDRSPGVADDGAGQAAAEPAAAEIVVHTLAEDVAQDVVGIGDVHVFEVDGRLSLDDGIGIGDAGIQLLGQQAANGDHVQRTGLDKQGVGGRVRDDTDAVFTGQSAHAASSKA